MQFEIKLINTYLIKNKKVPFEQIFLFYADYTPFSRVILSVCPSLGDLLAKVLEFLYQKQVFSIHRTTPNYRSGSSSNTAYGFYSLYSD